jgi:hypothetical protein
MRAFPTKLQNNVASDVSGSIFAQVGYMRMRADVSDVVTILVKLVIIAA